MNFQGYIYVRYLPIGVRMRPILIQKSKSKIILNKSVSVTSVVVFWRQGSFGRGFFSLRILLKISSRKTLFWFDSLSRTFNKGYIFSWAKATYTQYHLIRTTVDFLLVMVLIFSKNFTSNGPYVVLNFFEFTGFLNNTVFINWKSTLCF